MTSSVLSARSLNRATLARQLLLERTAMPAADVVELLDGRVLDISDAFWSMLLVDGVVAGTWKLLRDGRRTTLAVRLASRLSSDDKAAVEEEATRLLDLIAADAATRDVRIIDRN